jgi:hypothetical protein
MCIAEVGKGLTAVEHLIHDREHLQLVSEASGTAQHSDEQSHSGRHVMGVALGQMAELGDLREIHVRARLQYSMHKHFG